ncbi:PaaI family thioesterase [Tranquillimonas alkanivorans]|uniref:Uncharacterized domain 1-containing protein n=1 Tax=Tranquillimonas alkanivorans TaxID=441119 RepID=A0A1I5MDR6_9RHOB|nr:PaaI family thioesterase [Tranquillimonas alkanivorans]SFP07076.1 uncharacterized domain 1-containing protein [Tranquillimonas alkanivorans]
MKIAQTPDELATREQMLSMSGLEFMHAMLEGRVSGPVIAGVMNFALKSVEPKRVVFRGTPDTRHLNPMGGVHGGWYGTVLDSAFGCAVMTTLPRGSYYTTLEYKVNLTRALPMGMEVLAEATVSHAGRSTAVVAGEIRGREDGKLYATGTSTCLVMTPR